MYGESLTKFRVNLIFLFLYYTSLPESMDFYFSKNILI